MGDRGNIVFRRKGTPDLYFYAHWSGTNLPVIVKTALARRKRWDDPPYLARIVFDTLRGNALHEETGYGIDTQEGDNSHSHVVLDMDACTVTFAPYEGRGPASESIPFGRYIETDDATLLALHAKAEGRVKDDDE